MSYLSIYEKSMPETLSFAEKCETAKKAGFDGVEISVDETDRKLSRILDGGIKADIINEIKNACLPVRTMCLSGQRRFPFGSLDPETRKKSREILCRAVDFASECGIRIIQIPGYDVWYEKRGPETEKYFIEGLNETVPYAARAGVIVALETMEDEFMNTTEKAAKYVNIISSPYLQIYPDLGNVRNGTEDYLNDLKKGAGHIAAVHLKDTKEGIFRNLEIGEGRVDFANCINEALSQKVGIFNCEIWYDGKSDPVAYLRRNHDRITEFFGGNR